MTSPWRSNCRKIAKTHRQHIYLVSLPSHGEGKAVDHTCAAASERRIFIAGHQDAQWRLDLLSHLRTRGHIVMAR